MSKQEDNMKRLTQRHDHGIKMAAGYDFGIDPDDYDLVQEILARLAAYEDTGLEPEEIERIKTAKAVVVDLALDGETLDIKVLRDLLQAKQQGRLVVLPCKVGDTVYRLQRYFNDATLKSEVKIKRCTIESINLDSMCTNDMVFLSFENIGKTVFLTREEAERALEGGQTT